MIKVGITENIIKRKTQLEYACGVELHIVAYTESHAAESFESYILNQYAAYGQLGEWLDIPMDDRDLPSSAFRLLLHWRNDVDHIRYYFFNPDQKIIGYITELWNERVDEMDYIGYTGIFDDLNDIKELNIKPEVYFTGLDSTIKNTSEDV